MKRALAVGLAVLTMGPLAAHAQGETLPGDSAPRSVSPGPRPVQKEVIVVEAPERKPRLDVFYLEGETGAQYVALQSLSVKRDVVPTSVRRDDVGVFVGAATGIKLVFLTLGPHFRVGHFNDWDLWTLNLDLGFHAPLGPVEPFLRLEGGYARLGRAFDAVVGNNGRSVRVQGYDLGLAAGADYFATRALTVSGSLGAQMVGMHRPGVDLNSSDGLVNDYYKFDGVSAGLGVLGGVGLGLHL